ERLAVLLVDVAVEVFGQGGEGWVEEREEGAERLGLAAVGGSGDEQEMARLVLDQVAEEGVALLCGAPAGAGVGAGVRLVDQDELGGGAEELVPPALLLDVVGRDDGEGVPFEDRLSAAVAFEPRDGAREDERGVEVELIVQGLLPLLGEVRG